MICRGLGWMLLGVLLVLGAPPRLVAQESPSSSARLEQFVQHIGRLWAEGDAVALVNLAPDGGGILMDTGAGIRTVEDRHAVAALRELFSGRENVAVRAVRVTFAGGTPPRAFGELSWGFRPRRVEGTQVRSVYVGAVWERTRWKLAELRIMP